MFQWNGCNGVPDFQLFRPYGLCLKRLRRPHQRSKDGKDHTFWSLVETVRTANGLRQRTLCYWGELNGSAQARWLKSVEVFNEQGRSPATETIPFASRGAGR
jgi:hypothetical protein